MVDQKTLDNLDLISDGRIAADHLKHIAKKAMHPSTDAFTQCTCKQQMFLIKCLIEDLYNQMPEFPQQEKEWEQERLLQLLKRE